MDITPNTLAAPLGRARSGLLIISTVLVVALAGCASPEPPTSQPPAASTEGTAPGDADPAEGGSGVGTITVGTTTYKVLESVNCEPVSASDVVTRVFEVIATAQSADGGQALFFGYTDEQSGIPAHFIDYQGPEGTWGTPEGNAHFSIDGGTLSGTGVLVDDANTQSIMVQFEFTVPDELVEC